MHNTDIHTVKVEMHFLEVMISKEERVNPRNIDWRNNYPILSEFRLKINKRFQFFLESPKH